MFPLGTILRDTFISENFTVRMTLLNVSLRMIPIGIETYWNIL
jgi:hypothetical protein